jgi:hypothetical protein
MSSDKSENSLPRKKAGRPPGAKNKRPDGPPIKIKSSYKGATDGRNKAVKELKRKVREQTLREIRAAQEAEAKAQRAAEIARQKEEEAARLKAKVALDEAEAARELERAHAARLGISNASAVKAGVIEGSNPEAAPATLADSLSDSFPTPQAQPATASDTSDTPNNSNNAKTETKNKHTLRNALPNNALGLATFHDAMFLERGYKLPAHMAFPILGLTDKRIEKLLIIIGPGSAKSTLISTLFPAFTLGQDPTMTILGISAGEDLMQGFMSAIMDWIEHNFWWQQLFPDVRPDKAKGWSTERGMYVTGHRQGDPDASFFPVGLSSKALTGKHARLIICDDLHDKDNSASVEACQRVRQIFYNQIMGRADPSGCRYIVAGRRWHQEDLYGHLKSTGEWVVMELPVIRENSPDLYWDITIPAGLVCCFNEHLINPEAQTANGQTTVQTPAG